MPVVLVSYLRNCCLIQGHKNLHLYFLPKFYNFSSYIGRRWWHPTPVLLPGKSLGQRSLIGWQSMGSLRVWYDWATSLSLFPFMHWRRKWQPTPVVLAWRIPGTGEPGGLPSMGSHRVGHDWSDLAAAAALTPFSILQGGSFQEHQIKENFNTRFGT